MSAPERCPGILAARTLRGWTQVDLARRAGIPAMSVSHYETGRRVPSVANLCALADALETSVDALLGRGADCPGERRSGEDRREALRDPEEEMSEDADEIKDRIMRKARREIPIAGLPASSSNDGQIARSR